MTQKAKFALRGVRHFGRSKKNKHTSSSSKASTNMYFTTNKGSVAKTPMRATKGVALQKLASMMPLIRSKRLCFSRSSTLRAKPQPTEGCKGSAHAS